MNRVEILTDDDISKIHAKNEIKGIGNAYCGFCGSIIPKEKLNFIYYLKSFPAENKVRNEYAYICKECGSLTHVKASMTERIKWLEDLNIYNR